MKMVVGGEHNTVFIDSDDDTGELSTSRMTLASSLDLSSAPVSPVSDAAQWKFDGADLTRSIDSVALCYGHAAVPYREQKDMSLLDVPCYQMWRARLKQKPRPGLVCDLGCASGFPIAADLLANGIDYLGVDVCADQIALARCEHPNEPISRFCLSEMLGYVSKQPPNSLAAVCVLYSMFHLPRVAHVRLLAGIFDALHPGGALLLTVAPTAARARYKHFSEHFKVCADTVDIEGAPGTSFFSQFSPEWYELTLRDVGFELIAKMMHIDLPLFADDANVWFMLAVKPEADQAVVAL